MSESNHLARFVRQLTYDELPSEVVEYAKILILDGIGVALGGFETTHARIIARFVKKMGGSPESTVWVYGDKVPCPNAAFANGVMIHSIDFDDTHDILHPGCAIILSAFAIAEKMKASGKELITAIIAGYEVSARVALAVNPWHRRR